MLAKAITVIGLLAIINIANPSDAYLAKYITPCSRTDPKLNECSLKTARASMKKFSAGDPAQGIPPLEPLYIKEIKAIGKKGEGINVVFTDAKLLGCSDLNLYKFKIDVNNKKVVGKALGDLVLDATYEISGRILIIPLSGNGHAVVNLRDLKLVYSFDYEIVKRKDGQEYIQMTQDNLKYEIGKASFRLENLFNGDKILGESTNRILNESWKDVVAEVGPPVAKHLKDAFGKTIRKFLSTVTVDELFLP